MGFGIVLYFLCEDKALTIGVDYFLYFLVYLCILVLLYRFLVWFWIFGVRAKPLYKDWPMCMLEQKWCLFPVFLVLFFIFPVNGHHSNFPPFWFEQKEITPVVFLFRPRVRPVLSIRIYVLEFLLNFRIKGSCFVFHKSGIKGKGV